MKRVLISAGVLLLLPALFSLKTDPVTENPGWEQLCQRQFLDDAKALKLSTRSLQEAIDHISEGDSASVKAAISALRRSRNDFKKIEYFMEYFFQFPVNMYNKAPVYEIEEPYMEYQSPIGFQVVEDLLFEEDVYAQKKELREQAAALATTAADIPATMYRFQCSEEQLLESVNEELIRIMSLGITGYDAPLLKSGITESGTALKSIGFLLLHFQSASGADAEKRAACDLMERAAALMTSDADFDRFDRLTLLADYLVPAQRHLLEYYRSLYPAMGAGSVFNYAAPDLYSAHALKKEKFDPLAATDTSAAMIALGKRLFSEPMLSQDNTISCATCHKPEKYFTDGLPRSRNIGGHGFVKRNAPGLLYSAYQYGQFLDARDSSFVKQVYTVLQNPDEMHMDLQLLPAKLSGREYRRLFAEAFHLPKKKAVTTAFIARALAAYERTLTPFNSPFDQYMAGNRQALNPQQQRGFNLFMGKAQCGSCHFAPVFNGALPPLYNRTELEVLGTPLGDDLSRPVADSDSGRYDVFKIGFYKHAFKTPTVRNSSETGPYMHNGGFRTLDSVIEFYNRGGGNGIGLEVATQTLSDRKINLSRQEVADVKSFLESLKDTL